MKNLTTVMLSRGQITLDAEVDETVTCSADGIPISEVFWKFSSHEITTERGAVYQEKGNGRSILHVGTASLMDEGNYICVAENKAGNFEKSLQKEFKLTVPSHLEVVIAETQECSTTITVRWKASSRASNVKYKIVVKSAENESDIYRFPDSGTTTSNMTFSIQVRKWMMYNITVTPCLKDTCKDNYSGYNYTRRRTGGLPGKVENLKVQLSNKYTCIIKWNNPSEDPVEFISDYKVIVYGRLNNHPPESSDNANTNESIIDGNMTTHTIEGKPNFRYNVGIQTKTCAGFGDIEWKNASCITDSIVNLTTPEAHQQISGDGTLDVTITIPMQGSDDISCTFVIVKVRNPGDEGKTSYGYSLDDLVHANSSSDEYIALALDIKSASELKLKVTLGDERVTTCELLSASTRLKRSAVSKTFSGQNAKLDQFSDHSIFIVTSSYIDGEIFLTASESVAVAAVSRPGEFGDVDWRIVGPVTGSIALIVLIFIGVCLKRCKANNPSVVAYNDKAAKTSSNPSNVELDDKTQGYEVVDNQMKAVKTTQMETNLSASTELQLHKRNAGYEVVTNEGRPGLAPVEQGAVNAESPYEPYTSQREENPGGYETLNITQSQDPDHVYSKIKESDYEPICVTGETLP